MKEIFCRWRLLPLLALVVLLAACARPDAGRGACAAGARLKVAIRAQAAPGLGGAAGLFLSFLETALLETRGFTVHERKDISFLAEERFDQSSGLLSSVVKSEYLADGVVRLVYFTVKKAESVLVIQVKLGDMETGEILLSEVASVPDTAAGLEAAAGKAARKFSASVCK